jgi:ABC-2 type transport system permease protein
MRLAWNGRAYWQVLRNALASDLEYRSNYVILMFSSVITVIMEFALFRQVYAGRAEVGGLPADLVPAFVVLGIVIRSGGSMWGHIFDSIEQIRDGSFRRFLLQPIHYPSYFWAQALGPKLPTWVLCVLTVLMLKAFPGFEKLLPLKNVIPFLGATFLSYVLLWQIYLLIVYLSFWLEEAQFLSTAINIGMGIFSGSLLPLNWLPEGLVFFLKLTPFPLLGDYPLRTGLGLLAPGEGLQLTLHALVWVVALTGINAFAKAQGLKRYEAFGG